ncbi:MAG: serine O-acetyltransferase, partial [Porticoccaceae bacterium]
MESAVRLATSIWQKITDEATQTAAAEPVLADYLTANILDHGSMAEGLGFYLANKLAADATPTSLLRAPITSAFADPDIVDAAARDIQATIDRDSACGNYSSPFLYYK